MVSVANQGKRKPHRAKKGRANPVDEYIGSRIRQRRLLLGLTQEGLANAIGLTFQQIQKYERGANRVGASRLYTLGVVLDVPVDYFFNEMPRDLAAAGSKAGGFSGSSVTFKADVLETRETARLVQAYNQIKDAKQRRKALNLLKAMASSKSPAGGVN